MASHLRVCIRRTVISAPSSLLGQVLGDFDARTGTVAPNSTQLGMVSGLGATGTWNRFGTPASLINYNGYLATGLQGPDAARSHELDKREQSALPTLFD